MYTTTPRRAGARALSLAIAAVFSCTAGAAALDGAAPEQAALGVGEDGSTYALTTAADDMSTQRSAWQEGKVAPEVSQHAFDHDEVRVIIYLYDQDASRATAAAAAKASFRPQLDALAHDIQAIERKYRPSESLPPEEEAMVVRDMYSDISAADQAELDRLRAELDDKLTEMRRAVDASVPSRVNDLGADVLRMIAQGGGKVHTEIGVMNAISATLSSALLNQLAKLDAVATITLDRAQDLELDVSMSTTGFPTWWNSTGSYDGGAYDAAVIDSGVQQSHPNLSPNVFFTNAPSPTDSDGHGTHVAGIVASTHGQHTGGAYGLDALIWARSGFQSTTMTNMHWTAATAGQTPEALNHSLGYGIANTDDYNANDTFYDAFIRLYDISVAKSAGNSNWSDSAPTITHPATAYNLLAVANMDDRGTLDRSDDFRSTSSSVGPTVNNRRKPDITAPGTNIMSTNNSWAGGASGNNDPNCWNDSARVGDNFMRCSGTSMAAPHVTAAGVLMNDAGVFDPMVQKAILINTADAWTSNNTSSRADDGPVDGSLWDKSYGWGYLDMQESHFNRTDYFTDSVVPRNDNANDDDYKLYRGFMFANEKATLVWEKRAGTYVAGLPALANYGLSDLNLRLYDGANGASVDLDLQANDNVHQVAADQTMDAVIKVYSWSTSFAGAAAENFALATEENFEAVDPPSFARFYSRPNWVGPNQTFDITVHMDNVGGVPAHANTVGLNHIAGLTVNGGLNRTVPTIAAGGRQSTDYSLSTNGLAAGLHWIPLQFISNSYAESYSFSTAQGVSVRVETTPPVGTCSSAPTYSNTGAVQVGFSATDTQTGVDTSFLYVRPPGSAIWFYTGQSATGTSGTFNYNVSGDGSYGFAVRSRDRGGNWEALPSGAECATTVDRVRPESSLTSPALDLGGSIPLSFSVSDAAPSSGLDWVDFWYRRDDTEAWTYTGQFSTAFNGVINFTPPGDGLYHFFARARDNAQNMELFEPGSSTGDTSTVYDTLPPTGAVEINAGAATTASSVVTLSLAATDEGTGVTLARFSNDNSTWSAWQPYTTEVAGFDLATLGGDANPGIKKVYVQFRDGANRVSGVVADTIELVQGVDSDGDGVLDDSDNCTLVANADQRDTNGDGYGNVCDADLNNDGVINVIDLGQLRAVFFSNEADADFNGDGVVNVIDLGTLRAAFFGAPGPSGIAP